MENAFLNINCINIIWQEYCRRKDRNPRYSLRAFAKDLKISKTALSDVLSKKRSLSRRNADRIADRLGLNPAERHKLYPISKKGHLANRPVKNLEEDQFRLISDWYYFAILNWTKIKPLPADPSKIAKQLGITELEAKEAIHSLERLGFIEIKDQKVYRSVALIRTSQDVPSAALRKHHRQNLQLAEASLDRDPVELRDFNSLTMSVDTKNLPKAKALIRKFKETVCKTLQKGKCDSVYTVSIQLFPTTLRRDL